MQNAQQWIDSILPSPDTGIAGTQLFGIIAEQVQLATPTPAASCAVPHAPRVVTNSLQVAYGSEPRIQRLNEALKAAGLRGRHGSIHRAKFIQFVTTHTSVTDTSVKGTSTIITPRLLLLASQHSHPPAPPPTPTASRVAL